MVEIKTRAEIGRMRRAGLVVADTLRLLRDAVAPGVTTLELDELAEETIRTAGAVSNFLGYHGFPASICTSVNDEIVHGIPSARRVLRDGDIVSVDCGAIVAGWHGDAAVTVPVGTVRPEFAALLATCEEALWRGLAAVRPGGTMLDVGRAIETYVRGAGRYGLIREYGGHGIGTAMHQDPFVPNYARRQGGGMALEPGLALAVEPMLTLGSARSRVLDDEWTVVTRDRSYAAHFEHTVAITERGAWVLTAPDGGRERLGAAYGGPAEEDLPVEPAPMVAAGGGDE